MKGIDKVDYKKWSTLNNNNRLRGHSYKLVKRRYSYKVRGSFFSQRVINKWNLLPEKVVGAGTVNSFKNKFDKYKKNKEKRKNGVFKF